MIYIPNAHLKTQFIYNNETFEIVYTDNGGFEAVSEYGNREKFSYRINDSDERWKSLEITFSPSWCDHRKPKIFK
jgi:lysyl-tRNA synthetase class I